MTIENINGCVVHRGYLSAADTADLEELAEEIDYFECGTIPTVIAPLFGDLFSKTFLHDSRAMAYVIDDMMKLGEDNDYNIAFIRRISEEGESWKQWPLDNVGSVLLSPIGDYHGGFLLIGDRRITLNPGDILQMPARGPAFKIIAPTEGTMYLLSLHNLLLR